MKLTGLQGKKKKKIIADIISIDFVLIWDIFPNDLFRFI